MWLIENVKILDAQTCLDNACVVIDGNRFVYVGDEHNMPPLSIDKTTDGQGSFMLPGFVNAHTHVPMTLFRNAADDLSLHDWLFTRIFPMEERLTAESAYWSSMLAIAEMLRFGVTAFNDMYFFVDDIARAAAESGIRATLARGVTGDNYITVLSETRELYTKWHNAENGRIRIAVSPHAEYTNDEPSIRAALDLANELDIPIHTHISETRKEHEECLAKYGKTPLQWYNSIGAMKNALLAHCVMVNDEDIELIKRNNCSVLHCPGSNMKLASGFAPIPKMLEEGINVCLGTDGAASNNALNIQREMYLASVIHKGHTGDPTAVTAREALTMASQAGARALSIDAGLIKEGMLADFILVDTQSPNMQPPHDVASACVYSMQPDDVRMTCVDGHVLYNNGAYTTIDIEKIRYMVNQIRV